MKINTGERFYIARTKLNKHNKDGKIESINTVAEKTNIPISSLFLYEHSDEKKRRLPNMKNALQLADYYGVNVLWLLGQPGASESLNESNQVVTRTTGLSSKSIDNLQKITDEDEKQTLNRLLETDSFRAVITWLSLAEGMIQREANIHKVESWEEKREIESSYDDNFNVEMKLSPKESARYFLSRATQTAQDILTLQIAEQWTQKIDKWTKERIKGVKKHGER